MLTKTNTQIPSLVQWQTMIIEQGTVPYDHFVIPEKKLLSPSPLNKGLH